MKNQIKNIYRFSMLILLLGVAGMTKMYAQDFSAVCETGQTLYYKITEDTPARHYVKIICPECSDIYPYYNSHFGPWPDEYTQPSGNIILPSSVVHNGVTYIVTEIGNCAFKDCNGLTGNLTIPNTVTSIGQEAFDGCSGFTGNLVIPNSVTSIGYSAFGDCSGFESIVVESGNTYYDSRENCNALINTSTNELMLGCKNTTILNSVTSIGDYAFYDCSGFTGSLTLPNSITKIGWSAFEGCSGLTGSLTIPNSVTSIGQHAFEGCNGFTGDLTIPNSVTTIGGYAFRGCSGFESIVVESGNTYYDSRENSNALINTSTNELMLGCKNTTIPNSVTSIDNYAFYNCSGFTGSLTLPNSLTLIGDYAFYNCHNFTGSLNIPNSVTSIGDYAFYGCHGFTGSLTMGNSVTSIGNSVFEGCTGFAGSLSIGNAVTTIGERAFYGCSGFTGDLVIPNSVTLIGDYAFYNCSGFTGSLTIGNAVTTIGERAFYGCSGFTGDLVIPNSVTQIGEYAFGWCDGFTGSLIIGNSVTTIGSFAFYNCSGFTGSLIIGNSVAVIGLWAFAYCTGFTSVIIGNSVTAISGAAFRNCTGLNEIWSMNPNVPTIAPFDGVDKTIPVHVPCGSMNDYQNANNWSDFTNYYENPIALIVSSNDNVLGSASVTKYGDCDDNDCIVQALPYIGSFVNWTTPDGTVVSTDATYAFVLTEDIILVANFEPVANAYAFVGGSTTNHWDDPDNWIPNELPTETSSVGILADVEVNVDVNVASVSIYNSNMVTINPDVTLTVTETLSSPTATSLVVEEGGQLVHANDGASATVKRIITPYTEGERDGWHLIASPLADDVIVSEVQNLTANEYDLYYYDEPTHYWMNQEDASNDFNMLENNMGYLYGNGNNCPQSFEVQVGYGTSTIDYFPFYTYYDNSISESLFLAEELENVGVTVGAITSLSWYATNQTGDLQSNISIWMANVSEDVLVKTSHNTSGMTLVYTGAMIPEIGWNEFVFNEGNFAWDGVSNILICVQRNNGAWNSKIQWQSHNCGFVGMTFAYRDHSGSNPNSYDMVNETYSMYASTSRANTIFKVNEATITLSFMGELENGASMVDIPLSYTETAGSLKGFNLVGNPFAHDVTSYTATNVAEGCFRMNEAKDNLIVSEVSEPQPLKPTEGFFVKATAEGASITFNAPRSRGETARKGFINLELSKDGKLIDRLIVKKDGEPLEKLSLNEARTKLFAQGEHQELAIVSCEGNEQAVCFKAERNGTYTLNAKMDGLDLNYLHLIDNMTGNDIDLLSTPSYTFEAKTSDYASRFRLVFSASGNTDNEDEETFAFINNGNIIITDDYANATLQIVDMLGRVVVNTDVAHDVSTNGITSGVYVLQLINGNDIKTQKIVIR